MTIVMNLLESIERQFVNFFNIIINKMTHDIEWRFKSIMNILKILIYL